MDVIFWIGILLFLIGVWQTFRRGPHAGMLGLTLLIFALGAALTFSGNRPVGSFVVFGFVTWFVLMQLFALSTKRRYYFHIVPFVIIYAVAAAYLLRKLEYKEYFWWYLGLTSLFLLVNLSRQLKARDAVKAIGELDQAVVDAMPSDEVRLHVKKQLAGGQTKRHYVISTTVVFAGIFAGSFLLVFRGA